MNLSNEASIIDYASNFAVSLAFGAGYCIFNYINTQKKSSESLDSKLNQKDKLNLYYNVKNSKTEKIIPEIIRKIKNLDDLNKLLNKIIFSKFDNKSDQKCPNELPHKLTQKKEEDLIKQFQDISIIDILSEIQKKAIIPNIETYNLLIKYAILRISIQNSLENLNDYEFLRKEILNEEFSPVCPNLNTLKFLLEGLGKKYSLINNNSELKKIFTERQELSFEECFDFELSELITNFEQLDVFLDTDCQNFILSHLINLGRLEDAWEQSSSILEDQEYNLYSLYLILGLLEKEKEKIEKNRYNEEYLNKIALSKKLIEICTKDFDSLISMNNNNEILIEHSYNLLNHSSFQISLINQIKDFKLTKQISEKDSDLAVKSITVENLHNYLSKGKIKYNNEHKQFFIQIPTAIKLIEYYVSNDNKEKILYTLEEIIQNIMNIQLYKVEDNAYTYNNISVENNIKTSINIFNKIIKKYFESQTKNTSSIITKETNEFGIEIFKKFNKFIENIPNILLIQKDYLNNNEKDEFCLSFSESKQISEIYEQILSFYYINENIEFFNQIFDLVSKNSKILNCMQEIIFYQAINIFFINKSINSSNCFIIIGRLSGIKEKYDTWKINNPKPVINSTPNNWSVKEIKHNIEILLIKLNIICDFSISEKNNKDNYTNKNEFKKSIEKIINSIVNLNDIEEINYYSDDDFSYKQKLKYFMEKKEEEMINFEIDNSQEKKIMENFYENLIYKLCFCALEERKCCQKKDKVLFNIITILYENQKTNEYLTGSKNNNNKDNSTCRKDLQESKYLKMLIDTFSQYDEPNKAIKIFDDCMRKNIFLEISLIESLIKSQIRNKYFDRGIGLLKSIMNNKNASEIKIDLLEAMIKICIKNSRFKDGSDIFVFCMDFDKEIDLALVELFISKLIMDENFQNEIKLGQKQSILSKIKTYICNHNIILQEEFMIMLNNYIHHNMNVMNVVENTNKYNNNNNNKTYSSNLHNLEKTDLNQNKNTLNNKSQLNPGQTPFTNYMSKNSLYDTSGTINNNSNMKVDYNNHNILQNNYQSNNISNTNNNFNNTNNTNKQELKGVSDINKKYQFYQKNNFKDFKESSNQINNNNNNNSNIKMQSSNIYGKNNNNNHNNNFNKNLNNFANMTKMNNLTTNSTTHQTPIEQNYNRKVENETNHPGNNLNMNRQYNNTNNRTNNYKTFNNHPGNNYQTNENPSKQKNHFKNFQNFNNVSNTNGGNNGYNNNKFKKSIYE